MSNLSPQAVRLVEQAIVLQRNSRKKDDWLAWLSSGSEITPHIAHIAIQALSGFALSIEERIEGGDLSSALVANLENDLGYIADIEADLTGYLYEPERAYGS
jgi:hypothetical protein